MSAFVNGVCFTLAVQFIIIIFLAIAGGKK